MDQGNLRANMHVCPCACVCPPGHAKMPLLSLSIFLSVCVLVFSHAGSRPPCGRREWGAGSPARGSRRCAGRPSVATSSLCLRIMSPPAAASGFTSVPTPTVSLTSPSPLHYTHIHSLSNDTRYWLLIFVTHFRLSVLFLLDM